MVLRLEVHKSLLTSSSSSRKRFVPRSLLGYIESPVSLNFEEILKDAFYETANLRPTRGLLE